MSEKRFERIMLKRYWAGGIMKTYTYTETHCADCEYHKSVMVRHVRIGENEYAHYCQHPSSLTEFEATGTMDLRGRWIGSKDIVPDWCPLLPQNQGSG